MQLRSGDGAPSRERLKLLAEAIRVKRMREERTFLEGRLIEFFKAAWPVMDAAPYQHGWHLEAIAEHLEAVSFGHIRKLCINICPRHAKTLMCSVAWNAWAWCQPENPDYPLIGPAAKFMCLSYADPLAMDNSTLAHRLVKSDWFRARWGDRVSITRDQDAKNKFDTTAGGTRISGSFRGTVTGRGAGIRVYDDPHKMDEVESDPIREHVLRLYNTTLKSRITDPRTSAEVLIAQRGHENDLSNLFLDIPGVVHLNLPAEYDSGRHCVTVLKWSEEDENGKREPLKTWEDPRKEDGELLWPERFGNKELAVYKSDPHEWSSQWQQAPTPRGGNIIKREWWQLWDEASYPVCSYKWGSADTAYTSKEENDPTGFTAWGLFIDNAGQTKIILLDAWRKRLELHIPTRWVDDGTPESREDLVLRWQKAAWAQKRQMDKEGKPSSAPLIDPGRDPWATFIATGQNSADRWPAETYEGWQYRTEKKWGLCEWLAHSCGRFKVNNLLIEGKASGISVAQELRRLHGTEGWDIQTVTPEGDKVARAYAVQALFSAGLVYAPDREWAQLAIDEVSSFPKGRYKDITDSTTMALKHVREIGLLVRPEERQFAEALLAQHRRPLKPLYEA